MAGKTLLAGVVGSPIRHSLSPLIHGEWLRRAGILGEYRAIEIAPGYDPFACAMDELREAGYAGVNVTIPHKEDALRYADRASDAAERIGAANMLTLNSSAGVIAANSDATGFRRMLLDAGVCPKKALVLGAGGAARAALWALRQKPLEAEILLANRTRARAEEVAGIGDAQVINWDERHEALTGCDLVVNTTSLGMTGQPPLEIDLSRLSKGAAAADIVYSPRETPLLKEARARGLVVIDGLSMLMHQAAPGFLEWFGGDPAVDGQVDNALRAVLVAELEKRGRT